MSDILTDVYAIADEKTRAFLRKIAPYAFEPVESATSDPARVQSDEPAQGERLRDTDSSSLVLSSSSLRTLVEEWQRRRTYLIDHAHHEKMAAEQAYVYNRCADELAALLSPVAVDETHEDVLTRSGKPDVVTDSATRSDQPKGE
jgi:hypothetical protein